MRKLVTKAIVAALAAVPLSVGAPLTAAPALAAPATTPATLTVTGHGYWHGRGLSQYGAYGYALAGWTWQQIIGHYYDVGPGGTTMGSVDPTTKVSVHLVEYDGTAPITVTGANGQHWTGRTAGWSSPAAASPVTVSMAGAPTRTFQGVIAIQPDGQIWNVLPLEQYVAGVVPSESPASWGVKGEAALEAQAVAARSYALSYVAAAGSICDTTMCQVYDGDQDAPGQPTTSSYTTYSDKAVADTAGQVVLCGALTACGASSSVARTEFSSSSGGYTAGGVFPPVVDDGDGYPGNGNPNHDWTVTVSGSSVDAAWPQIGTFTSATVTKRNGLGDMGGRVLDLTVSGTTGSVTVTGATFAWALGLRSDWFSLSIGSPAVTTAAANGGDDGYWVVGSDGSVFAFGNAPDYGSHAAITLSAPLVGAAATADAKGYWLVGSDGGVYPYGDASFHGSTANLRLNQPILGITPTASGQGYWLYASDGGIFSFGDARFYGSTGNLKLNAPIVGMAATRDGKGYWLVAADGGVFTFGDARFYGSTGAMKLNRPIVGMVPTADDGGYTLVAADGGVFTFGDARFVGSLPGEHITDTVTAVAPTADGGGYFEVGASGKVYAFGDATWLGDIASAQPGYGARAVAVLTHPVA